MVRRPIVSTTAIRSTTGEVVMTLLEGKSL